jgi:hypothetical protein
LHLQNFETQSALIYSILTHFGVHFSILTSTWVSPQSARTLGSDPKVRLIPKCGVTRHHFIFWCRVRIEKIYPNRWFYHFIKSQFAVRMRIIILLGLRPRDIIPRNWTPNSDFWAINSLFGIYMISWITHTLMHFSYFILH